MQALSMFTLAGRLFEGALGTYYRAVGAAGEPVLLFLLRNEPPGPEELARLQQAHDLQLELSRAPSAHKMQVLEPLAIVQGADRVGLALRHSDGEPLAHGLRRGALPVPVVLRLGTALAELCGALHERGVRLGACGPEPVLLDADADSPGDVPRVRILSLVQATPAGSAMQAGAGAGALSATALPYAAPEQLSGGDGLTPSTDLYSLGVLLYQALCGALPFDSEDPAELVHAHLARTPPSLAERAPAVPQGLVRIVEKLLSKAPAERYQTAPGLLHDLERLTEQLAAGTITDFALGSGDRPMLLALALPQDARLDEEHELLRALQAAAAGAPRVAVLSGTTGSGKTILAQRLRDPVREKGGLFVEVRCELADRTPHAALSRALRDLVRQLVREPADRRARLQRELVQSLGPAAQALTGLVPELELVLEALPKAPPLEGAPAHNRLRLLVGQLLRAVARPERPLVLFFDEAQWIDAGSLRLLLDCLCASPSLHVLVVAAVAVGSRAGEVGPGHPLTAAVATLRAAGVEVLERELAPLSAAQLAALVTRTLGCSSEEAAPLADVLHVKTRGNLLSLSQLLRTLQEDGLLRYDPRARRWAYDLGAIISHAAGEDAQAVLVQRIGRLRDGARRILALAACLGPEFELDALARLGEQDAAGTRALLAELCGAGLVHRLVGEAQAGAEISEERYRFLHSSVMQAAAALLTPDEQAAAHLRIGRALLAGDPEALPDRVLLAGVQQLNQGAQQLVETADRARLAGLNLLAGRRAKAVAANETAAELFRAGLALLTAPSDEGTELELSLQRELTESDFLCGRFQAADARAQALLGRARTPWDKAQVQALRARHHLPAARYKEAIQLGLHALALLDVEFPPTDAELQAQAEAQLAALGPQLVARGPEALLELPRVQDPAQRLRFTLVGLLLPPSFASRPSLFQALVGYALGAILAHGNTEEACTAYFSYGLLQVTTGDIQRGLRFSDLALRLYQRLEVHRTAGMVLHIHGGHINHWGRPLHTGVEILERSIQVSMAVGDLNHIGNGAFELVWLLHERGDRLDEVERAAVRGLELSHQIRNDAIRSAVQACANYVRCLRGEPAVDAREGEQSAEPPVDRFCRDSAEALQRLQQASFGPGIGTYHILHLILRYLFGQYTEAYAAAQAAAQMLRPVQSLAIEVAFHLFRGLTLVQRLAAADAATDAGADRALLERDLERLRRWAAACPENYAPLEALLRAEVARLRDQPLIAEELYDQAIEGARRSGFVHHAALASELAARFYGQRGRRLIAPSYLRAAYVGYTLWGALRKAAQLAEQHPELAATAAPEASAPQPLGLREALDVAAVVRIGQAIAAELNLDKVVEQLLRIALHHAGATRGALLRMHEGALHLSAQSRASDDVVQSGLRVPIDHTQEVPRALVQEVAATGKPCLVADASRELQLASEPCVLKHHSRSVLALPLVHRGSVSGVLYLENSLSPDVFRGERLQVLGSLCAQAATALENAQLYTRLSETSEALRRANGALEREVQQRTDELRRANEQLAEELVRRTETERARAALQEEIIRVQSVQLAELSTPLVPVAESIMVLPLLGSVDAQRAQDIVEAVLGEAQAYRAKVVLIDVTGLRRVDELAASLLLRVSRALRLLGSQAILTGMRPEVAQTLVSLGADLTGVLTRANLQSGIAYASELVRSQARR